MVVRRLQHRDLLDLIADEEFLAWAAATIGIVPDPHFSPPLTLVFAEDRGFTRVWFPGPIVSDLPGFIDSALSAASAAGPFYLYRRGGGSWYEQIDPAYGLVRNEIIDRVVATTGIPEDFSGAIALRRSEWRELLTIITAFYVFGWSVGEDLHVVPENGSCLLLFSHHGELCVEFADESALQSFVAEMARSGYSPE